MKATTAGIDLTKNVFQVHGVGEHGNTVLRKQLKREQVALFFANLPTCFPMARSNSPTLGHPKLPQAVRSDHVRGSGAQS